MPKVDPALQVQQIEGVLSNFGWKVVKQTITEQDVTLVITKVLLPLPEGSEHTAD